MSTDRTAGFLWSATALGGILAAGSYVAAGPPRFWANWLLWFLFLFTLALGALFLVTLEHLAGARWSVPLRRIPERLSLLLIPLTAVGLVALGAIPVLYRARGPGRAPTRCWPERPSGSACRSFPPGSRSAWRWASWPWRSWSGDP